MVMKKVILTIMVAALAGFAGAQEKVTVGNKFFDNWYFGVNGAYEHQLRYTYMNSDRGGGIAGFELGKQATPALGVSFQTLTGIGTTSSANAFDEIQFILNGKLNLSNLIGRTKVQPRLFEVEAIAGLGGGREFYASRQCDDKNFFLLKGGLSFNFNLGKEKQWTFSMRPALVTKLGDMAPRNTSFELMAGLLYHFKNSNGKRYPTVMMAYSQAEVDRLNDEINDMRRRVNALEDDVRKKDNENRNLMASLNECAEKVEKAEDKAMDSFIEPVVAFRKSVAEVDMTQLSNIESIAAYMNKYPELKVELKGYASPEGNAKFNQKLSERRAFKVKEILVNKYGIEADRIDAKGMGIGKNFSKPEMNRAVIVKFNK